MLKLLAIQYKYPHIPERPTILGLDYPIIKQLLAAIADIQLVISSENGYCRKEVALVVANFKLAIRVYYCGLHSIHFYVFQA